MFIWVERADGVLAGVLALVLLTRFIGRWLILPRRLYLGGAVMGFCGWVAFVLSRGSTTYGRAGIVSVVWEQWVSAAPFILPLEGGLLGWLGARSFWRWCFLSAGVAMALLPWLAVAIVYLRQG